MERKMAQNIADDIEVVITSYNQGEMILDAVRSVCSQTLLPARIILVDDGSTEEESVRIMEKMQKTESYPVPLDVIRQENRGVSAARNTGLRAVQTPYALVLDGDDKLKPQYLEKVRELLHGDTSMVAASSWMQTFGVLDAVVKPGGGTIGAFLSRNCCPATHLLKLEAWKACGGYDESMRAGFEDWDFFLSILETGKDTRIGIVPESLLDYRTALASANVKSMSKRLELIRFLMEKHETSYRKHFIDAVLGLESISMARLEGWEQEMIRTLDSGEKLASDSEKFLASPSYGDGGMAAAVRIVSQIRRFQPRDNKKKTE